MLCYVTLRYITLRYVTLRYVTLCYVMLCYVMLCYFCFVAAVVFFYCDIAEKFIVFHCCYMLILHIQSTTNSLIIIFNNGLNNIFNK